MSARKVKAEERRAGLAQEVCGVCGLFLALYLGVVLGSWYLGGVTARWSGTVGRLAAGWLTSFMGAAALWLVVLAFAFSLRLLFRPLSLARLPVLTIGVSGILLATAGLLGLADPGAGGMLGGLVGTFAHRWFGVVGGGLLLVALFAVSAMITLELSPSRTAGGIRRVCAGWRQRRRERRQAVTGAPRRTQRPPADTGSGEAPVPEADPPDEVPAIRRPEKRPAPDPEFVPVPVSKGDFRLPPVTLLDEATPADDLPDQEYYFAVSRQLEAKLRDFGVEGKVVGISPGPVITTYEFAPAPGVKISRIVSLAEDIALGLKAPSVRIVGSIPGKAALGIEIPNPTRQIVHLRDILTTDTFQKSASPLTLGLGMDVVGRPVTANLARMPHLLIAGATGAGKSVAINTIICSILMKATPDEVRLLLVDPKRIELSVYEDIPHLLHPVVVDPRLASRALQWAVREMERRYSVMEESRVKSIEAYNQQAADDEKLPLIVVVIDELADLMMVSSKEVEDAVARLAQMARAAGMHLILATQRPSVDVLTGLIKANFPTRMSFKVSSKVDSRTILDTTGAEHLLGAGDMLFLAPGTARLQRIHGAYVSEVEIGRVVTFLKEQRQAEYDESVLRLAEQDGGGGDEAGDGEYDEKYDEAVALVCETGQASISMIQRRLRVGYNRAARMIEVMEREGIVGPADGAKPREVLARRSYEE